MDIKSREKRSRNMSKIRSKNTRPEVFIRSELHKRGYRFRVNSNLVEGHPDIYFSRKRIAVFIHGCYWHRHHDCRFSYTPKSNMSFWMRKFTDNIERDKAVMRTLKERHIRVIIVWECSVKKMMTDNQIRETQFRRICEFINDPDSKYLEI